MALFTSLTRAINNRTSVNYISRPGKILLTQYTSIIIQCSPFDYEWSTHNDEIRNLSKANGIKAQIADKRFSLNTMLKTTNYWLTSCENVQILKVL